MRRQLFRRPSWASKGDDNSSSDFFRRAEHTYSEIVAAAREARERNLLAADAVSSPGRQRETTQDHKTQDNVAASSKDSTTTNVHDDVNAVANKVNQESSYSGPSVTDTQKRTSADVLCNESSRPVGNNVDSINQVSRDYGGTQNARWDGSARPSGGDLGSVNPMPESNRETQLDGGAFNNAPRNESSRPAAIDLDSIDSEPSGDEETDDFLVPRHEDTRDKQQDERAIHILITSEIENTKPLIVIRKMSQSLRDVRLAWCKRQNFPVEKQSSVILTWKGRRLFDVTTCRSLGISSGPAFLVSESVNDDDPETIRIHMEAVMEDVFDSKHARRWSPAAEDEFGSEDGEPDEPEAQMGVVLKSPELGEVKVGAEPKTLISSLIAEYRRIKGIPIERQVYLLFDGERLPSDTCVEDHEIADLDLIDVQMKQ